MVMTQIAMIALQLQNEVVTRTIKKRNPIAKALKFFTPKVIRDKTKYRRKDVKFWKREIWEWTGD